MPSVERPIPDWAARDREQDQDWIRQNLDVFWHMASRGFQLIGRGAIFVDATAGPMGKQNLFAYFNVEDVARQEDEDINRLVQQYGSGSRDSRCAAKTERESQFVSRTAVIPQ